VINLKSLSNSDPRRKEIMALASEYKKAQRAYKELKKKEGDQIKEVDRARQELREGAYKVDVKEEKERKRGKEWKGRKKKSLEKAREKSRDQQRVYEDKTLQLKRLQAELKDFGTQLNAKGFQLKEAWQNRGRPKEQAPGPAVSPPAGSAAPSTVRISLSFPSTLLYSNVHSSLAAIKL
jgi:hypothetical protein